MFKSIVSDLIDPNTGDAGFEVYGVRVVRDSREMRNVCDRDIRDDDDIIDGVLKNIVTDRTFPIMGGVASLLIDQDVELRRWGQGFTSFQTDLPTDLKSAMDKRLEELRAILRSRGFRRSLKKANELCEKAEPKLWENAQNGDLEAITGLGWMFQEGMGVAFRGDLAIDSYRVAIE